MQPLPNLLAPIADRAGKLIRPWVQFLQQFVQQPPNFVTLSVGTSPFSYTAKEPGFIVTIGGTVSDISLTRGTNTLSLGTPKFTPVSIKDVVTITFSVLPTITFIPIYGANTTNG